MIMIVKVPVHLEPQFLVLVVLLVYAWYIQRISLTDIMIYGIMIYVVYHGTVTILVSDPGHVAAAASARGQWIYHGYLMEWIIYIVYPWIYHIWNLRLALHDIIYDWDKFRGPPWVVP